MKRLLKFLLTGDAHLCNWTVFYMKTGLESFGSGVRHDVTIYHLKCKHCGDVKSKKLIGKNDTAVYI